MEVALALGVALEVALEVVLEEALLILETTLEVISIIHEFLETLLYNFYMYSKTESCNLERF